jgi:predicted aspartyl protease
MIEYSRDFDPPAPFMDVIIAASSDSGPQRSVGALLDTGAEISIIPQQIAHELQLSPYTEMIIEAFGGRNCYPSTSLHSMRVHKVRMTGVL